MKIVPAHIFRAYDIRGVANKDVTEELCHLVGQAFGSELREHYNKDHPTVIVGRDARTHSPTLEQALIDGLTSAGCHVKKIGQTPTPTNYFALCHFEADGSVQVTASHNPKEDNGLKLQIRNVDSTGSPQAASFSGEALQGLRKRIEEKRFLKGQGSIEELDAVTPYIERVTSLVKLKAISYQPSPSGLRPASKLKAVVDFGNGVTGPVYGDALRKAGVNLIPLFEEPDGTFPNHIADPTKYETLATLQETVKKEKADCGIAFDGDGDRVGFVDERGNVIAADYLLLLLAEDHLQRFPGATIVYTVSMSSILETEVKRLGGKPVMCIVGHSFVEEAMKEHGSQLGGEQSGHFFLSEDFYDHDDALVAALRVLSIFAQAKTKDSKMPRAQESKNHSLEPWKFGALESFSQLFSHFPKIYQSPEWRPHCPDDKKTDVVQRISEHFQQEYPCNTLDGVRIDFGDGAWAGIRQSNTSPKISVVMEARSPEKLKEMETIVREHLATYEEIEG